MSNTHSIDWESGSSQYAWCADSASLSITQSFTIESWVNFESLPGDTFDRTFAAKMGSTANKRSYWFSIRNVSGVYSLRGSISTDGTYQAANDKLVTWTPSLSTWYHLALVYDHTAPNFKFYVGTTSGNDAQQGSTQTITGTSIHNNDSRFSLSAIDSEAAASNFMDGLQDEVRIWNVARSLDEINATKFKQIRSPKANLAAGYNLNNNLLDISGNGNNLTEVGSPAYSTSVVTLRSDSGALFFGM